MKNYTYKICYIDKCNKVQKNYKDFFETLKRVEI